MLVRLPAACKKPLLESWPGPSRHPSLYLHALLNLITHPDLSVCHPTPAQSQDQAAAIQYVTPIY